jgi:hypothetical protein
MTDLLKPRWEVDYGSDPMPAWDASVLSGPTGPLQTRERRTAPRWNLQGTWTNNGLTTAEILRFFRTQRGPAVKFYFYTPSSLPFDDVACGTGDGLTAAFPFAGREAYRTREVVKVATVAKVAGTDYFLGYANRLLFSEDPRMVAGLTNLLTANQSSVETDTTGFGVLGAATLSASSSYARFGTKSLKAVCPGSGSGEGFYLNPGVPLAAAQPASASVRFRGAGSLVLIFVSQPSGTVLDVVSVTLAERWMTIVMSGVVAAGDTSVNLSIRTDSVQAVTFYVDGLQIVNANLPGAWALGGTAASAGWMVYSGATVVMTPGQAAPSGPATATRIVTSGGTGILKIFSSLAGMPPLGSKTCLYGYIKVDGTKDLKITDFSGVLQTVVHGTGWTPISLSSVGDGSTGRYFGFCALDAGDSLDFTLWHPWAAWTDANLSDPSAAWGYIPTQETAITADSLGRERVVFVEGSVPVSAAAVTITYEGQRLLLGRCTSDVQPKTVDADLYTITANLTGEEV